MRRRSYIIGEREAQNEEGRKSLMEINKISYNRQRERDHVKCMKKWKCESHSGSVMSYSLPPHGL